MSFLWVDAVGWVCDDCDKAFQMHDEAEGHEESCEGAFAIEAEKDGA